MLLLQFSSSSESSKPFPAKLWLGCACCLSLHWRFRLTACLRNLAHLTLHRLSLEGRSVSKNFCFRNHAGIVANFNHNVLAALLNCSSSAGSANSLGHTDVAISLNWFCWRWRWSKTPTYPFWFDFLRPMFGSIALPLLQWNSHSLWFCYFCCLRLVLTQMLALQLDCGLGTLVGTFSVASYSDFKKISAALSILHMCFALSPYVQPT